MTSAWFPTPPKTDDGFQTWRPGSPTRPPWWMGSALRNVRSRQGLGRTVPDCTVEHVGGVGCPHRTPHYTGEPIAPAEAPWAAWKPRGIRAAAGAVAIR